MRQKLATPLAALFLVILVAGPAVAARWEPQPDAMIACAAR